MSRRRPPKRPGRRPAPRPRALRRRTLAIAGGIAALALLAWGGGEVLRREAGRAPRAPEPTVPALADSIRAAQAAGDWEASARAFAALARREPRNPMHLLGLALARHNATWAGTGAGGARPLCRTSLERIAREQEVFALLDSAAANARDEQEWLRIRGWTAQTYDGLGLPLDAMRTYTEMRLRDPGHAATRTRAGAILAVLRAGRALPATGTGDPVEPPPAPAGR